MFTKIGACVVLTCLAAAVGVSAQETVNYASVSGRVTDPSGGVVPGAQVTARQTDTNVTATAITDSEGRFRFPYLRVGPYEITVHDAGFADATRRLTLTLGSAFELPIVARGRRLSKPPSTVDAPRRRCSRRRAARSPARSRRPRSQTCR